MGETTHSASAVRWSLLFGAALCGWLSAIPPARAADTELEAVRLAAIVRQLNTIDRLATESERLPRDNSARLHFDYARLHNDIARVRAGIDDYLIPRRAQPRDPTALLGLYRVPSKDLP